ncbi:MAG: sulfatase-like hydrolase/transferase [Verrucomicrobiota bacterium]
MNDIIMNLYKLFFFLASVSMIAAEERPNFLIITADDLNYDSVGCYGSELRDTTPNVDALAAAGLRFHHAHVAATACYPSRSAISTGRRGHRSGGEGFFYLRHPDVPTVQQLLHDNGYRVGILGKVTHSTPYEDTPWDVAKEMERDTDEFEKETAAFIDDSLKQQKPFYLIVNSHDPHRPYYDIEKGGREGRSVPAKCISLMKFLCIQRFQIRPR